MSGFRRSRASIWAEAGFLALLSIGFLIGAIVQFGRGATGLGCFLLGVSVFFGIGIIVIRPWWHPERRGPGRSAG